MERGRAGVQKTDTATTGTKSFKLADGGIGTAQDFINVFSALVADVLGGHTNTNVANAACNAGGKVLKAAELMFKYAAVSRKNTPKMLLATNGNGHKRKK